MFVLTLIPNRAACGVLSLQIKVSSSLLPSPRAQLTWRSVMAAYGQTQYSPALQAAGPYTPYTHHTQGYSMPSYSEYSHFLNHLQKQKKKNLTLLTPHSAAYCGSGFFSKELSALFLLLWKQQDTLSVQHIGQHQCWTENELRCVAPQWHYKTQKETRGGREGEMYCTQETSWLCYRDGFESVVRIYVEF